jgi:hypothetical protein
VVHAGQLQTLLSAFPHVRLLLVHDANTLIIAGKPEQCTALVARLGAGAAPVTQGMVGHCVEVAPHAAGIAAIHEVLQLPGVEVLSFSGQPRVLAPGVRPGGAGATGRTHASS